MSSHGSEPQHAVSLNTTYTQYTCWVAVPAPGFACSSSAPRPLATIPGCAAYAVLHSWPDLEGPVC